MEIKLADVVAAAIPSTGGGKLKHTDVVGLIELATLLSSGVGLADAFATLKDATSHPGLRLPV